MQHVHVACSNSGSHFTVWTGLYMYMYMELDKLECRLISWPGVQGPTQGCMVGCRGNASPGIRGRTPLKLKGFTPLKQCEKACFY